MCSLCCRIKVLSLALPIALLSITGCGSSTPVFSPKALRSVSITPSNTSIAVNATEQLTAMGDYSDGSTANLTTSVTWDSSNTAVATVSSAGLATGVGAGTTTIKATADGFTDMVTLAVTAAPLTVTSIAASPATASITSGATQQFTANATYSNNTTGALTSGVTWTSSNTAVATVSSAGLATGVAAGTTTIKATANGFTATATLTVTAVALTVTAISVSPATSSIISGATQQFAATATYSNSVTSALTSGVTWTSSNPAVATVSSTGLATAVAAGTTIINALADGFTSSATLTVTVAAPTVTAISVSPATSSIISGSTQQFAATAAYSNSTTGALTSGVTWTSSNIAVATVSSTGLATGVGSGTTTIKAIANGFTATATLTVTTAAPTVTAISVSPATASITSGAMQQFTATATYSNGSTGDVTASATWASTNATVASISSAGLATGNSSGSTTISATMSGHSGSATLNVVAPALNSITVAPSNASFAIGATEQFTATANYSNNTTADVTSSATWSSSNTSAATISSIGLATGQAQGTTTISAALNGVKGSTTATVTVNSPVNITTWHVDANRSGLNNKETVLTPANVAPATFGKLFSCPVDGYVYGSPLILSNQTINGATHNVLYVATENDSVYAYDSDTCGGGTPLWKVSLLQSGETPLADKAILPYVGVTSTPVIDPTTGTLYVLSTQQSSSGGTFRLNALDVTTGAQKFGGPVTINASVAATNSDSVNGVQTLSTSCLQRAALLLANGNVYIGFASCHSGWLLAFNASTLAQVGVFNASPKLDGEGKYGGAGGIWMGGAGPVADSEGNVYVTTGNGPWDGQTAWGDSVLKFAPTPVSGANGTLQPIDYFTPSIYQFMDCFDADLAAGGLMLIPGSTTLIAGGKTGTMYLVDSTNLGHESSSDTGAFQEQVWGAGLTKGGTYQQSCVDSTGTNYATIASYEIFGTTAFFNGAAYLGVTPTSPQAPAGVRQFNFMSTLSPQSDTSIYQNQGSYGTSPFISANGTSNGIVWMIQQGNPLQNAAGAAPTSAALVAFDALNYPNELYSSTMNSADTPGYGIKFSSPVVANGKVYISTGTDLTTISNPRGEIDVYGLKK